MGIYYKGKIKIRKLQAFGVLIIFVIIIGFASSYFFFGKKQQDCLRVDESVISTAKDNKSKAAAIYKKNAKKCTGEVTREMYKNSTVQQKTAVFNSGHDVAATAYIDGDRDTAAKAATDARTAYATLSYDERQALNSEAKLLNLVMMSDTSE